MRYAPTTGYVRSFEIPMRSPDWVRAALQKTIPFSPLSVAYGGAYSIRPYNRVCAILRNTDAISQPDTCCPSKNHPVFAPLRGRLWGVCDTPLQSGTCDSSKYRCNAPIGYVRFFEMPMRSPDWVRARVQKTDLYSPPSVTYGGAYAIRPYDRVCAALQKTVLFLSPFGAVCGAYSIRPYDRVCAILRNTDAIL